MKKFPNKMIEAAYHAAKGHEFMLSTHNQRFTDENGSTDYDYHAMLWLKDNNILERIEYDKSAVPFTVWMTSKWHITK